MPSGRFHKDDAVDRFMDKVVVKDGCWDWIGGHTSAGYGSFNSGFHVLKQAHVYSYALFVGPVPEGLCVLHDCDNRSCVNPQHLFLGTKKDNNLDKVRKNRQWRPIGELAPAARLTSSDVFLIRKLLSDGTPPIQIANNFNMSRSAIYHIRDRYSWAHLPLAKVEVNKPVQPGK